MGDFDFLDYSNMASLLGGSEGGYGSHGNGATAKTGVAEGNPDELLNPQKAYGFKNPVIQANTAEFDDERKRQMGAGREG